MSYILQGSDYRAKRLLDMANLIRSPRAPNEWTRSQLREYRVKIGRATRATQFFEPHNPPRPFPRDQLIPAFYDPLIQHIDQDSNAMDGFLIGVTNRPDDEKYLDHFICGLLGFLANHANANSVAPHGNVEVAEQKSTPLLMCGFVHRAKTNVTITCGGRIVLVEESKVEQTVEKTEPQLLAEMIAAFQFNERTNPALIEQTMYGIIMRGLYPHLYKANITRELSDSVKQGIEPNTDTRLVRYTPVSPRLDKFQGMLDHHQRKRIMHCGSW